MRADVDDDVAWAQCGECEQGRLSFVQAPFGAQGVQDALGVLREVNQQAGGLQFFPAAGKGKAANALTCKQVVKDPYFRVVPRVDGVQGVDRDHRVHGEGRRG